MSYSSNHKPTHPSSRLPVTLVFLNSPYIIVTSVTTNSWHLHGVCLTTSGKIDIAVISILQIGKLRCREVREPSELIQLVNS